MPRTTQTQYNQLKDEEQEDSHPADESRSDVVHQQTVTPPSQPTVVSCSEPQCNERYNIKIGFITGIVQICIWLLLLLITIFIVLLGNPVSDWFPNFIYGAVFLAAGILGVISRNRNTGVIIAYMVMCILSAVAAGGGIITVGVSAVLFKFCDDYYDRDYDWCGHVMELGASVFAALTLLVELVTATLAAAYCCVGIQSAPIQPTDVHTNDPTASHVQAYGLMVFMPAPGSNPSPIDRVQAPELNQSPMDESQVQESNPAPTDPSQAQELNTPPIDRSQTQGSSPTPDQSVVPN